MRPVYMVEIEAIYKDGMRVEPTHHLVSTLIGAGLADAQLWSTKYTTDDLPEILAHFRQMGWHVIDQSRIWLRDPIDLRTDAGLKEFWLDNMDYFNRVRVLGAFEPMTSTSGKMLSEKNVPFIMAGFITPDKKALN